MEGTIIGWLKYIDGNVGEDSGTCYRLIIEYFDNGQAKKYETPDLNFACLRNGHINFSK